MCALPSINTEAKQGIMKRVCLIVLAVVAWLGRGDESFGQSFGTELQNTMMPASGGMGGASIARPQDLTSAINGNPASLTQFHGTQFLFGGGWAEPTFNFSQASDIPTVGPISLIEPFSAKSTAPGSAIGNIGVTQDFSAFGLPATVGLGFVTTAGVFADFRQVPESNGTNAELAIFNLPLSVGVDMTERWSLGASMAFGIAFFDGPFVGTGGMTPDYALRGTIGTNYLLTERTTVGAYYQSKQSFTFDNAFLIDSPLLSQTSDVAMDLPQNIGFGVANTSLLDGRLLLACDVTYKLWSEADLYEAVYDDQWVVQLGHPVHAGTVPSSSGLCLGTEPDRQHTRKQYWRCDPAR